MKLLAKKTCCTVATSSPVGSPHVVGVVYEWVDGNMWIHSMATSRKARSIAANGRAAVTVPFRRLPAGPPFTIHFQADAQIVPMNAPEVTELLDAGELSPIAGHGALDAPDGCFVKVTPRRTIHSYGPGASVIGLIRDPLNNGAGSFRIDDMFYCPSELSGPWGVDLPYMADHLWFHVVTSGSCTVRDPSGVEHSVRSGDVIVFPHGGGQTAYDRPHAATSVVFDLPHEYMSEPSIQTDRRHTAQPSSL
ncbi:MAG: hypothetical protein ACI81L_002841 [Verrucomicrobiales bacterium]|jgi:hypothetical protein